MEGYIKDCGTADMSGIGAKAINLMELLRLGVNVPRFICISGGLLDALLSENSIHVDEWLSSIDFNDEKSIEGVSVKIKKAVANLSFPEEFTMELAKRLEEDFQNGETFSVRSSSFIEDNDSYSFAGQFDTYLYVDKEEVTQAVLKCFASLYSANVLTYAKLRHIDFKDLKMGVIIQDMVVPETSGVIFTANPQGLLNEMVIIHGRGTGNNVVEDKTPVTTYYYNKTDKNYYYETAGDTPILHNELLDALIGESDKIMKRFGEYVDIEYAVKGDEVTILQSRPITTMDDKYLVVLDNSNIVESYPGITLPLTYSFIKESYTDVFKNIAYFILKNDKVINENEDVFKEMLGSVNGRVYYKISNWYTLIRFLPFGKKIIPIWQDMMGVKEKRVSQMDTDVSFIQTVKIYIHSFFAFLRVPKNMRRLEKDFKDIKDYFDSHYNDRLSNQELYVLYEELKQMISGKWGITLLNDAYAFLFTGLLKSTFKKYGISNYEEETNQYISGIADMESVKPVKELVGLANLALRENKVGEWEGVKNDEDAREYLSKKGVLPNAMNAYIDTFGDRSLEELKLESKTFRSSPTLLFSRLIEYINNPEKLKQITLSLNHGKDNGDLIKRFGFFKRRRIGFLSKRAVLGIQNREISRLNRSRIYGMTRSIFLSVADHLKSEGFLEEREDVFYLEKDELFEFINHEKMDLKAIINVRKRKYQMYKELPIYSRLVFAGREWDKVHKNVNTVTIRELPDQMIGTPCSNGVVTGEVVVVNNPNDAKDIKDKILVTKMTDPGWVFLLTVAKGIIAEKGSLLSHTAIISRELKIPSIVGVDNITDILRTGDVVTMNGNTGEIQKIG